MDASTGGTGGLREELRGDAQTMTASAKQRIHSEVDARKGDAASQAKTLSTALNAAASELDGGSGPVWFRSFFEQASQTLQSLADTIEQKDSRQLSSDAKRLARENPTTFLAGCALAGFAAARVLRAGTDTADASTTASGRGAQSEGLYEPYAPTQPYASPETALDPVMPLGSGVEPQASLGTPAAAGEPL